VNAPLPRALLPAGSVVLPAPIRFPVVALPVGRLGRWLRRPRTARAVEGASGGAPAVLGATLLVQSTAR
jgi:threonine/homoserine/homoserine lactone efflux protein